MRTDNDTAILRRVVDGVGKEVREYPGDLLTVYKELGYFFRILHFDMAIEALRLHTVRLDCIIDQFNRLRDLRIQLQLACLHLCHFQQFTGNFEQAVAAFSNTSGKRDLLIVHISYTFILQQFETHKNSKDRGFQFMGDSRDKSRLGRV